MKICKRFPKETVCPICKTNENKECILIAIVGTGDKPNSKFQNYESELIHVECLELWYDKEFSIIYQRIS